DRAHVDPVPDQHAGHQPADEPGLHGQGHGQHADAGQRHADVHQHDGENAVHHCADGGHHAWHGRKDAWHDCRYPATERSHRGFRRLLPSAAQYLLLGTALLRHTDLLVVQIDLRYPRRHRHDDRRHPESHAAHGSPGLAHAADGRANAFDDRDDEEYAAHHADDVPEPEESTGPDEGHAGEPG